MDNRLTLIGAVTNILHKRVTEEQAMKYAHDNFAVLCAHIKAEVVRELLLARDPLYRDKILTRNKALRRMHIKSFKKYNHNEYHRNKFRD